VCHVDLLSHFRDPVAALKAMGERVAPGGMLVFEVALFGGLSKHWYPFTGRPNFPTHLWFFNEAAIDQLLKRAGLRRSAIEIHSIGVSTIISSLLIHLFRSPHLRRAPEQLGKPLASGPLGNSYYRFQNTLGRIGKWLPRFGPSKAFVTAVPITADP
jgi:Methyltransferase domain